jgi:hypothetical protein
MRGLSQEQLRRLARLGAVARLDQLRQEEAGAVSERMRKYWAQRKAKASA